MKAKNELPEGWEEVRLGEITGIYDSQRIPLSETKRAEIKGEYPYCGANGVIDHINKFIFDGEYILLAEDGGVYSKFDNSAYIMNGKFWVNNHAHILQALKDKSTNRFLLYTLNYLDLRPYIVGSTRHKLNQEKMRGINIPLPPLLEQQRIAEVLSTVDGAIEKVDEAIKRTQRLKKGLMQRLLMQGIGHKEFKDTEIGRIPKEWEVGRLGKCVEIELIMGQSPPSLSYNKKGEGLPFLQGKAEFGTTYPIISTYTTKPIKRAQAGDILMSVRAPVGNVNLAPFELCIGRGLSAIRIKKGSNLFYFYWFQKVKKLIENIGKGSTFKAITKDELERLSIPLPPREEQQRIAEILSEVDRKIELEKRRKEKLERIKKGLMEDLLTGEKRVRI